ncbi:MAG: 23S rRNA (guanosine(2251)-2'-O)-methyltransferase RlmB [Clostridia bacterium]|nr:23S rRNA (guanosine(2251)-2'-O)-methyltransferase RlmB [Clostridia bacterium]
MLTEGRNAVLELIKSGKDIDKICMEKNPSGSLARVFAEARRAGIRVQFVDREALDRASATGHHQGVIAYGGNYEYANLDDIISSSEEESLIILCDGIEDVHNLGSIIRVAECVGADGVVIPSSRSASVTEAVVRISAGAASHVKVARVTNLNSAVDELKKNGFWVYALEADGKSIYETEIEKKAVLIIGGEDSGVKRLTREKSDFVVSLPLYGKVNSLNASVALGVAAYEVVRRRNV